MQFKLIFLAIFPLILAACGGGGGGGGDSANGDGEGINGCGRSALAGGGGGVGPGGPGGTYQISGQLNVDVSNKLESECNNTLATAVVMAPGDSYTGHAKSTNAGYKGITARSTAVIHDLYTLNVSSANVRVTLSFTDLVQNSGRPNDMDLFLLDSSGTVVVASSEGTDQTVETVTTTGPGTYYVGVRAFEGQSEYLVVAGTTTTTTAFDRATVLPGVEYIPGEILVKFKSGLLTQSSATKLNLLHTTDMGSGIQLMRVGETAQSKITSATANGKIFAPGHEENEKIGATLEALYNLNRDPNVAFAEPNYIRRALATPNDQYYQYQWHYPAINLPLAWNNTIRGANTIIAVIDTGIVSQHPDLAGQIVPGYDFISDISNAGDGSPQDNNPEDVGDGSRPGESSFHGTHVAGTVAAASNNSTGIAGVAWNAKIMPLRVLGKRGGTDADIVQAIRFAAGLSNVGTFPSGFKRADVINMSLGGPSFSNSVQTAVTDARGQGVIVVAAAGNENTNKPSYPAAYTGVISVSAVGFDLRRAPYSNYGNSIDIAAPGGDTSVDRNGDKFADGVLSTLYDDTAGKYSYVFYQGTSMAAPHIAGVLALMRGVNPSLTPATIDQLIDGTHPTYRQRIATDIGTLGKDELYGHGLIDAKKALDAAIALNGSPGAAGSFLITSAEQLEFDAVTVTLPLNITNGGDGVLNVTSVTSPDPWISISPASGVAPIQVTITVNRSGFADGTYSGKIDIVTNASSGATVKQIPVTLNVNSATVLGDVGDVFVLVVDPNTGETVNDTNLPEAIPAASNSYRYAIRGLAAGSYYVFAGTDRDNDGFVCEVEDACGTFGALVQVTGGVPLINLNFSVNNAQNPPPPSDVTGAKLLSFKRSESIAKKGIRR